ncbi:glycosyl transferase family 1 [Glaciihabitans tibetensis]|uniref:D-inositol 3-phosphate glycosyltransferase n=1 Tax=Glaciihabitans tibetensis TaxID=1266600 RepID=A0A2T0V3B4_9MICO|nr:glycosyltransferase [Glaciihabitans tibetensis]PRY64662.1 glycosyl transferase family 1 [Glaciihabitans tibetensis]
MTYTEGGRRYLIDKGRFDGAKVTAIGNSTDTEPIRTGFLAAVRDQRPHRSPSDEPRALYVGGLDPSKKIHFLIEAAREAARISPNFKLIVVGKGILSADVDEAIAQGVPIDRILEARGEGLGQLGSIADVMWMPGRVGLAAVDAVAMGLPVHTTPFPFHAPEIELLTDDEVAFLPENSREFAARSIALMAALPSPEDRKLRQDVPTVTSVAKAFSGVVRSALTERG